ncbi:5'-nucleotidase C-terminal domain-containing protein [Fervidicella metallireducens]|uniref:5'-nucleotidase C-terminal domain-containing protein n=1 Tax=Fervidicella metallireducens TaxID=655338 RepID=UPI000684D166|nr:5'-nucleotidase C-terminal domain-containing protein [Fervidicella metallireducens]
MGNNSKSKKLISLFMSLIMFIAVFSPQKAFSADLETGKEAAIRYIDILSFNDFHGALKQEGKNIGAANLAGEIKKLKQANPSTIVVAAGDLYQGSAMSNLLYGKPVSEMLKSLGVIASAVGNHEFDWGIDKIASWSKDGGFDFLAANIVDKKTGKPVDWAKPYKVVEVDGVKIGFIGLATPETAFKTKPENVKDIEFKNPSEVAKLWADKLKNGELPEGKVDVAIALTHLGSAVNNGVVTGEAAELCNNVNNIDAVISGHTHMNVAGRVNGKAIVQGYYNGRSLAKLSIGLDKFGRVTGVEPSVIDVYKQTTLTSDPEVKAIYDKYSKEVEPILSEVIGTTDKELTHDKTSGPSILGEWTCDVMKKSAGVQIAVTNGGGLRTSIPQGQITVGKLYEVMPFDNTLVKMKLKGSDLKKVIENGILNESIGWVQVSGVKVYYNKNAEAGNRITSMRLMDGTKVDMDKYYTVVTNDFMATGGDGYDFKAAIEVVDTGEPIREALIKEIKAVKNLSVEKIGYLIDGEDTTIDKPVEEPVAPAEPAAAKIESEKKEMAKVVSITAKKGLNVRASYAKTARKIGALRYGTKVKVISQHGDWYEISYKGKKGYIFKLYTK